jgi:hypothetical protein
MRIDKHKDMQTCTHAYTKTQAHRSTGTQTRKPTGTQTRRHTGTQTRRPTGTQTRRHTGTQTDIHMHTDTLLRRCPVALRCPAGSGRPSRPRTGPMAAATNLLGFVPTPRPPEKKNLCVEQDDQCHPGWQHAGRQYPDAGRSTWWCAWHGGRNTRNPCLDRKRPAIRAAALRRS